MFPGLVIYRLPQLLLWSRHPKQAASREIYTNDEIITQNSFIAAVPMTLKADFKGYRQLNDVYIGLYIQFIGSANEVVFFNFGITDQ